MNDWIKWIFDIVTFTAIPAIVYITTFQLKLKTSIENSEKKQIELEKDMAEVSATMHTLQSEIPSLRQDIGSVRQDIASVRSEISSLSSKFSEIDKGLYGLMESLKAKGVVRS